MFTGIVEAQSQTLDVTEGDQALRINIEKPDDFNDLKIGDSVACNGICLTVEAFDANTITFALGFETLKVTGWRAGDLESTLWNLERSLRFGDRIHGHLVSGHVDGMGEVKASHAQGDSWILQVLLPENLRRFVWQKSSVTLQGVSLTVNSFEDGVVEVCLVPETLKKTNLTHLRKGDGVTIEADYYMKGLLCTQPQN